MSQMISNRLRRELATLGIGRGVDMVAGAAKSADLASTEPGKGAELIGYDGGAAAAVLDGAKPMENYTALRAYTGRATGVRITAQGIAGFFQRADASDTSADNGGTVIVDAAGRRWRRLFLGAVNVQWFGAVGNGVADDTAAIHAARDFLAAVSAAGGALPALLFPAGVYRYSESPNWAISGITVMAVGEVKLRYSGTGTAVLIDAGQTGFAYNVSFGALDNYFKIEAPATAQNGIYCRSVHHSNIFVNVRGCGADWAAIRIEFAVCTVFGMMASRNEGPWYMGAVPKRGIEATRRAANDTCSACIFINPVIEAVSETGIWFDHAIKNLILNGTSEGNPAGWGVVCTENSQYNNFDGIDLEVNALGGLQDGGRGNSYNNILNSDLTSITATALNAKFVNGVFNAIQNAGNGTEFVGIEYGSAGGELTDTGRYTTRKSVYFITGNRYLPDLSPLSLESTVSCPNNTATTVLTLPATGSNFYKVVAQLPSVGAASVYGVFAVIYQDLNTARIVSKNDSQLMTVTLSGRDVQITQTSGIAASVVARAIAI